MSDRGRAISLSDSIKRKMSGYFNDYLGQVTGLTFDKYLQDTLSFKRAEEQVCILKEKIPGDIENKRLLEIGSGFGVFVANSILDHDIAAYGVEPDGLNLEVSKEILSSLSLSPDIISADQAESLHFEDNSFDIVYSSNVLEHVRDPKKVFEESIRVLKPGGYMVFVIPNYASWWDGHYGVIWLPNMPKYVAKLYVRMLGRDPRFINSLQLVTLRQIQGFCREFEDRLGVIDWGWDVWERRLDTLNFTEWADLSKLKMILQFAKKLRLIKAIKYLGRRAGWLTPVILTAKKKYI